MSFSITNNNGYLEQNLEERIPVGMGVQTPLERNRSFPKDVVILQTPPNFAGANNVVIVHRNGQSARQIPPNARNAMKARRGNLNQMCVDRSRERDGNVVIRRNN